MDNFRKTLLFPVADDRIYVALTNSIPKWWTEMFEGISSDQGKTFTIRFGTNVFKTMVVEELVPNKKVAWKVIASLIDIPELKNKTEWINTKIVWEISSTDNQTELHLTHFGLTPQIECYSICESGWHNFTDSLSAFINTGIGKPFKFNLKQFTMKHKQNETDHLLLKAGEGRMYNCGTITAVFKADENETANKYSISEWWLEPNSGGPGAHQHEENDEVFYGIEGTTSILVGDEWLAVEKGTFLRIPAKTLHDFENRTNEKAGLLNFFIPGGFERNMPSIVKWFEENK